MSGSHIKVKPRRRSHFRQSVLRACYTPPDYANKARVIKSGLVKIYKQVSRAKYAEYAKVTDGVLIKANMELEDALEEERFFIDDCPEDWKEAGRIAKADYKRTNRLKHRVERMIKDGECVFATLTFTDDVLSKTSKETRRKYVTLYLKSQQAQYVGNIDYGGKYGREHYHALVKGRINPLEWQYGALNVEKVRDTSKPVKLAKYVNKLTNHAIKDTCKRNAIIYSRDIEKPSSAVLERSSAVLTE